MWSKLLWLLTRQNPARDLDEEIGANLELEVQDHLESGMSPEQARAAARGHFGNVTLTKEKARDAWTFPRFESLLQDVRYGLRGIGRSKAFSLLVILTLALGIGATTAIFSVVYTALLRPLPYPAGERLVWLGESTAKAEGISVTWVNYQHWRRENHSFEDMAAFVTGHFTLTGRGEPLLTRAGIVTPSFFRLLGMRPVLGRTFSEAEDRPGMPGTVVLSHAFWAGKLNGDPGVIASTLNLNGRPYQIVGVLPPGPEFFGQSMDFYLPLGLSKGNTVDRSQHGSIRALGLLKPGIPLAVGRADLDLIMERLAQVDPGPENDHRAYGEFLADSNTKDIRPTLLLLMGAVALVLLIACTNVASLLLARGAARTREIAIRTAIGAGRTRLVRQLFTESLLMAASGGLCGVLLAYWGLRTLVHMAPRGIPRLAETGLDLQVLLFAAGITFLTAVLVGFAPVFAAGKLDVSSALKDNSRSATGSKRGKSFRGVLVVAEIAITLVLCFASGLLIRSLVTAQTANPGFAADNLLALELILPGSSYKTPEAVASFYNRLTRDLRALPGVTDVGAVNCPPSSGGCGDWFYSVLGKPRPAQGEVPVSLFNMADPDYFRSMKIPIREGRAFQDTDRAGGPLVAVVNEEFAHQWWPNESAVGRRIKFGGPYLPGPLFEIVGVAGNVSQMGLDTKPMIEIYRPFAQSPQEAMVVMIRSSGDPGALATAVRRRVAELDRNLPIQSLRPFERTLAASLERRRFITLLLSLFAVLAMILAAIGVYGLLNYWVRVREAEIAIRMALGAERGIIVRWVSRKAFRLAAAGITIGVLGGWAASRWMESLVFGVSAQNAATMIGAAAVVITIAMLASIVPTWRATQVDTVQKLQGP
ncbi:MAG: ADOP family duplicated permease [Bryobacteraceae bacterium]